MTNRPNIRTGRPGPRGWTRRNFLATAGAAFGATALGPLVPSGVVAMEGSEYQPPAVSDKGVVVSASAQASAVGIEILNRGGNAMDAAVAMVFAVGVARPEDGGIGGGGYLVYRGSRGGMGALDFDCPLSLTAPRDIFAGPGMHRDDEVGHRVVGVPGVVAGMAAALQRCGSGRFSLADLIAPAEHMARFGVMMDSEFAALWALGLQTVLLYPATAEIYGVPRPILIQTDYADSLRLIMEEGQAAFYDGPIAEMIVDDMEQAEENARTNSALLAAYPDGSNDAGFLTRKDFRSYRAIWREPLVGDYRGHQIIVMPPSTTGGVVTLEILNILEGFDLRAFGQSSADHVHVLAEAQKLTWADRNRFLGDPDYVDAPVDLLTSKEYAALLREQMDMRRAQFPHLATVEPSISQGTNHISVIDSEGNAVAVTTTVGGLFGSGVVAPGTGFVLNNQPTNFHATPVQGSPHNVEPGKRGISSMSPTIVMRKGQPVLVLGGSGGRQIIMGVVQTILNLVDFRLDLAHAVDAERIDAAARFAGQERLHLELSQRAVDKELDPTGRLENPTSRQRFSDDTIEELKARGHTIVQDHQTAEYNGPPFIEACGIDLIKGLRYATMDPRHFADNFNEPSGAMGQ